MRETSDFSHLCYSHKKVIPSPAYLSLSLKNNNKKRSLPFYREIGKRKRLCPEDFRDSYTALTLENPSIYIT